MALLLPLLLATAVLAVDPLVTIKNGTLAGLNSTKYSQDLFLGIPYAQPPLGDLRYRLPQSLNTQWDTPKDVKSYGPRCWETAGPLPGEIDDVVHNEDCLTLSVTRPKNASGLLPVVVWIHGGDLVDGGSSLPPYDMQNFVGVSQKYGQPVIAVSIQYRLGGFGFLGGSEVLKEKVANLGWHDQRLALRWIQENIGAFGGNKDKVSIWGESAGAQSVGAHLVGWGGKTEGLFRGAISQSGGPISYEGFRNMTFLDDHYAQLLNSTNCTSLDCLRAVPAQTLITYFRAYDRPYNLPMVDGVIYTELPSISVKNGRFAKIPYIIGTCSDEEAPYTPLGLNTDADVFNFFKNAGPSDHLSDATVTRAMELYPNDPPNNLPLTYALNATAVGAQYKRAVTYDTDFGFAAGKRVTAEAWATSGTPVWAYRFDTLHPNKPDYLGVYHSADIDFVFSNLDSVVAEEMTMRWVWFATYGEPQPRRTNANGVGTTPWREYKIAAENLVFNSTMNGVSGGAGTEPDTWRAAGISFINSIPVSEYAR